MREVRWEASALIEAGGGRGGGQHVPAKAAVDVLSLLLRHRPQVGETDVQRRARIEGWGGEVLQLEGEKE